MSDIMKCPECKKKFICVEHYQTPGCREKEELYCPYCYTKIYESMTYYYMCRKMEEFKNENNR